jgi:general secretion pathway protein B
MSFILDALKKSENERQRHQGPSLIDVPMRKAATDRPWWVIALAALLVLNLVVFLVVLLRDDQVPFATAPAAASNPLAPTSKPVPPEPAAIEPPPVASTPALRNRVEGDPAVRSLAEEAGVDEDTDLANEPLDPSLAAAGDVPAGPRIVNPIQGPSADPVTVPRLSRGASREEENLPTINDLTANNTAAVPAMHLDIHVYSTSPAERFVFINMRKYREGEAMSEGPTIERIQRDGVVLNHRGLRFVLPRQ